MLLFGRENRFGLHFMYNAILGLNRDLGRYYGMENDWIRAS